MHFHVVCMRRASFWLVTGACVGHYKLSGLYFVIWRMPHVRTWHGTFLSLHAIVWCSRFHQHSFLSTGSHQKDEQLSGSQNDPHSKFRQNYSNNRKSQLSCVTQHIPQSQIHSYDLPRHVLDYSYTIVTCIPSHVNFFSFSLDVWSSFLASYLPQNHYSIKVKTPHNAQTLKIAITSGNSTECSSFPKWKETRRLSSVL